MLVFPGEGRADANWTGFSWMTRVDRRCRRVAAPIRFRSDSDQYEGERWLSRQGPDSEGGAGVVAMTRRKTNKQSEICWFG